jgi:primosomal protein N' (replication factor Y)
MPETYVSVAVPLPVTGTFTYLVPEELTSAVSVGVRVLVPFGRRKLTGFVVAEETTSDIAHVKQILDVLDIDPVLGPRMIELTRWISDYYLAPWGEVLRAALPPGINMESRRFVRITDEGREALGKKGPSLPERRRRILEAAAERQKVSIGLANREAGVPKGQTTDVLALAGAGLVELFEEILPPSAVAGTEAVVRLVHVPEEALDAASKLARRAPKQARVLELLADSEGGTLPVAELSEAGISSSIVTRLSERGLVERTERDRPRLSVGMEGWELGEEGPLTPPQERAVTAIRTKMDAGGPAVFLLHGVTGSGKTRVYSEAIRAALESGKSAIVLVPEISLTPQMVQRMKLEFGERVAVIHSGLSLGERYDTWRAIKSGQFPVVIGPRSAVFAPVHNLGVIVVDEEHEQSYKQSESPRYHARDVAAMRARLEGALVILGTATPSLESYLNARYGKYELIELPERIDAGPLPEVEIVDMREIETVDSEGIFSATLRDAISETLDRERQVILFLNRRGFASFVQCMDCGHSVRCEDCNVSMTYHSTGKLMRCHYCGRTAGAPECCSECGSVNLRFGAPGTQRVEAALAELFPDAGVQRMDQDTTSRHGSHWRILREFASGRTDILLGTQMIAKGLDFPRVGLVGVVAADVGLNLPDFRAGERTFQLLTQVAGRTGRGGTRGKVLVQTYLPDHYTITLAQAQHFGLFFEREIAERQGLGLGYPPHSRLVSVVIKGGDEKQVVKASVRLADFLEKGAGQMRDPQPEVLGPAPAPLERIKGTYRWQVVVRGMGGSARALISAAMGQKAALKLPSSIQLVVDVDPMDLL